ncbi:MFS transporter [Deinococcus sp.]|uniref:MFS transporter n=1 Tax=Deinococcus sp. TaxID=47478 RepID=UPI003C7C1FB8
MTPPAKLWNRSFVVWLLASGQSQLGTALSGIALSFLVLHQTGHAGAMAVTLACAVGPNLLMPLSGAWVDRLPLRLPLIAADVTRGVLQLTVALLVLHLGSLPLWVINAAALLGGFAGIFAGPASSAAFPQLVPESQLARANGLFGSVTQGAWLLGTLVGGVLVARLGPPAAILIDGASFLVMAALLPLVRLRGREVVTGPRPTVVADLLAGLRLMRRSKTLTLIPFIGLVLNGVLATVTVVTPKLMEHLGAGAAGYGVFLAVEGVGAVLGGALIAWLGARIPPRRATAAGLLLCGLIYSVMARFTVYPVLIGCSLLLGFAFTVLNTPLTTLMQSMVPGPYLGRVFAVMGTVGTLGMPVTLLLVSPLLDRYPAGLFFGVAGGVMLAGCAAWVRVVRSERLLPDLHAEAQTPEVPPAVTAAPL